MISTADAFLMAKQHTPVRNVRIKDPLYDAAVEYGAKNGLGNFSDVVRFALSTLLRQDGAMPILTEANKRAMQKHRATATGR